MEMETSRPERAALFLKKHPVIGIPVWVIVAILFGAGFLARGTDKIIIKLFSVVGTLLIILSAVGLVLWFFGSGAEIMNILEIYLWGQWFKLMAWLPKHGLVLIRRMWRWGEQQKPPTR